MTTSRTIVIGELELAVRSADLASVGFDTAIASDFEVEVEFSYKPEESGNIGGLIEDAVEPSPAEINIKAIKASANAHFEGDVTSVIVRRGSDLLPLLSSLKVTEMEDMIIKMVRAGE